MTFNVVVANKIVRPDAAVVVPPGGKRTSDQSNRDEKPAPDGTLSEMFAKIISRK
jgi:hypothetical protein